MLPAFIESALRYLASAIVLSIGLALQFVPLYQKRLDALTPKYPALKIISSRLFQLVAGFGLLSVGIDLLGIEF